MLNNYDGCFYVHKNLSVSIQYNVKRMRENLYEKKCCRLWENCIEMVYEEVICLHNFQAFHSVRMVWCVVIVSEKKIKRQNM